MPSPEILFGPRQPASDEMLVWIEATHPDWASNLRLIAPTSRFFRARDGNGHDTSLALLSDVGAHLRKDISAVTLDPLPELPDALRHQYGVMSEVNDTFQQDGDAVRITCRPSLLRQPMIFVNTLAHELMHMRLAPDVSDMPGRYAAHELATDLHCILSGFGVIQIQAAEEAGWAGYMTQGSRAAALAHVLLWQDMDPESALRHLTRRPAEALRNAVKWLSSD